MGTAGILPNLPTRSFQRIVHKFINAGMHLSSPVDLIPEGKLPYLLNTRAYLNSPIQARPGLAALLTGTLPAGILHSMRRLNDDTVAYGGYTRIYGIGAGLYYGKTTATLVSNSTASSFSGNPLSLVEFLPPESAAPWIYVADSLLMWKTDMNGNGRPMGYKPPAPAPAIAFYVNSAASNANPTYPYASIPHTFINIAGASDEVITFAGNPVWVQSGTAGAPALLTGATGRVNAAAISILAITFDTGTTGWATIAPTNLAGIAPGMRLHVDTGGAGDEFILVESVNPGSSATTTIQSIIYDSGTTGLCSIQLTSAIDSLERNAYINDSTRGVPDGLARVLSVTEGPDGLLSMRLSTTVTWVIGDTVSIQPSFRAVTTITHAAAATLSDDAIRTAVTAGVGKLTQTLAINLARIAGTRPSQPSDWIRLSVRFSNPASVSQVMIAFDVDAATNDFTQNYYLYAIRPNDMTPAVQQTSTFSAISPLAAASNLIDNYDPVTGAFINVTDQFGNVVSSVPLTQTGNNQWFEVWFRVSDLQRVGSDNTRTLANVAAIQLSFTTTATVNCDFDSLLICGSYGPDTLQASSGYLYRYRVRDESTGAMSRWSQPSRSAVNPIRQRVTITVNGSTDIGVDKIDFQRFGGQVPVWTYIGTVANDSTGAAVSFNDDQSDATIAGNPTGQDDVRAPFPVSDSPQSGTGYSSGTTFIASTGTFNVNWVRGMTINVNGIDYTVAIVLTTTKLETIESMGAQGTVGSPIKWYAPRPVIEQAPMPSMWGPVDGVLYACGDTRNQGMLYNTDNNNADSSAEVNQVLVTSPSEPLIAGCAFDAGSYVFSDRRMFRILRGAGFISSDGITTSTAGVGATATEVPNGKGLFSAWALAVGPSIWFLSRDGIYETKGGEPQSITDTDLYPLFPHDGIFPTSINLGGITVVPPQMNIAADMVAGNLRLSYYDSMLYFDYKGTDNAYYTLVYNTITKAWSVDTYARNVNLHYGESGHAVRGLYACGNASGGTAGMAYLVSGASDDGDAIACHIRTPSHDNNDPGTKKLWQDTLLDANPAGASLSITQGFDQNSTTLTPQAVTGSTRTRNELIDNSGAGTVGYNASLDITWSSASVVPQLFGWEHMEVPYPREVRALQTISTSHGIANFQHHRLYAVIPLISTDVVTLRIDADGTIFTYTVASTAGVMRKTLVPLQVMKAKVYSYRLSSPATFMFFQPLAEFGVKGWGDAGPYRLVNPFGGGSVVE